MDRRSLRQALTQQFCNSLKGKALYLPAGRNKGRNIFQHAYLIRVLTANRCCVLGASCSARERREGLFFWLLVSELPETVNYKENKALCIHDVI